MTPTQHGAAPARAARVSTAIVDRVRRPGFSARVHSVFQRALNLVSDDELLTLAAPGVGGLPNGIELEGPQDFQASGLAPGMHMRGDGERLRVLEHSFAVELDGAAAWSPFLRPLGRLRSWEASARVLAPILLRLPRSGGFRPLLAARIMDADAPRAQPLPFTCVLAERALHVVLLGLQAGNLDMAMDGATRLVGLGHGLTPSGDDALVGLSAALRVKCHPLAQPFAAAGAVAARARTTSVAETFLAYAAQGAYSARLHTLLDALRPTVPDDQLARALTLTLDWGETSGADCLLGVLLGAALARTPVPGGVP